MLMCLADNTMILFKMATDTMGADANDLRQFLEIRK